MDKIEKLKRLLKIWEEQLVGVKQALYASLLIYGGNKIKRAWELEFKIREFTRWILYCEENPGNIGEAIDEICEDLLEQLINTNQFRPSSTCMVENAKLIVEGETMKELYKIIKNI